jgi:hypothetical protein
LRCFDVVLFILLFKTSSLSSSSSLSIRLLSRTPISSSAVHKKIQILSSVCIKYDIVCRRSVIFPTIWISHSRSRQQFIGGSRLQYQN